MDNDTKFLPGEMMVLREDQALDFLAGNEPSDIKFFDGAPCSCFWSCIGGSLIIEFIEGE